MRLNEVSERIYAFQKWRFASQHCDFTSQNMFLHITEEIGEIARQMFNKSSGMRTLDTNNLREEITQVILELLVLARLEGIDIETAIGEQFDRLEQRFGREGEEKEKN